MFFVMKGLGLGFGSSSGALGAVKTGSMGVEVFSGADQEVSSGFLALPKRVEVPSFLFPKSVDPSLLEPPNREVADPPSAGFLAFPNRDAPPSAAFPPNKEAFSAGLSKNDKEAFGGFNSSDGY